MPKPYSATLGLPLTLTLILTLSQILFSLIQLLEVWAQKIEYSVVVRRKLNTGLGIASS